MDTQPASRPPQARAYAVNVLGCILGPLFACYVLLPRLSERHALILLSAAVYLIFLAVSCSNPNPTQATSCIGTGDEGAASGLVIRFSLWTMKTILSEEKMDNTMVRRDYAASVISFGEDTNKYLLVNGIGMTTLTPITKFIAHLPLAFHNGPPESALVICFGMGTTYRSALSWDIDTTAVELIPGVTKAFGFYHADAASFVNNPKGHIIIDDGRRYLKRTDKKFDVIMVDPPPPVEAAGSSLLFSREFYALARQHLNTGGILQMWYPGGEDKITRQPCCAPSMNRFPMCMASSPWKDGDCI